MWREAVLQRHPLQRGRPGGGAAAPVPNAGRASPQSNSAGGPEHPHPLRFAPGLPPLKRGKDILCGSKPFAEGVPTRGGAARRPPRNHPPLPPRTERSGDPGARGHRKSRAGRPWAPDQVRGGNRVGISRDWIGAVAGLLRDTPPQGIPLRKSDPIRYAIPPPRPRGRPGGGCRALPRDGSFRTDSRTSVLETCARIAPLK